MKLLIKTLAILAILALLGLAGCVTDSMMPGTLLRPTTRYSVVAAPSLTIEQTNLVSACMLKWVPNLTLGGLGSGSTVATSYTGPAYILRAHGLVSGGMVIESSTDLATWTGYPTATFRLTLLPTNSSAVVIQDGDTRFYRGKLITPNF